MSRPVALVTGGPRGIGAAVAARLADDGYDVAFTYAARVDAAETVRDRIVAGGARCVTDAVDTSSLTDTRAFVERVEDELGPVDVLVCSAGINRDRPLVLMSEDEWSQVIDINLTGTFAAARSVAFSMMKRGRGAIVLMSSVG